MDNRQTTVIYDAECPLCRRAVSFLTDDDTRQRFRFVASSSEEASDLLKSRQLPQSLAKDTVIVFEASKTYIKSDAVIHAMMKKGGMHRLSAILLLLPGSWRNRIYDWLAARRKNFY